MSQHPDPMLHMYISFAKSILRLFAALSLILAAIGRQDYFAIALFISGSLFFIAELLGIAEETV